MELHQDALAELLDIDGGAVVIDPAVGTLRLSPGEAEVLGRLLVVAAGFARQDG